MANIEKTTFETSVSRRTIGTEQSVLHSPYCTVGTAQSVLYSQYCVVSTVQSVLYCQYQTVNSMQINTLPFSPLNLSNPLIFRIVKYAKVTEVNR